MKNKEEIIANLERGWSIGMNKYYINALLFCLGREDLCIEILTENRFNKIIEEIKKEEFKNKLKELKNEK